MSRDSKVLLIGIDGGDPGLIERWCRDDLLPNIQRLKESGVDGVLESTKPPITASAWTSMATGKNPGKHGVYDFRKKTNGYGREVANSDDVNGPRIWDVLSLQGYKSAIANVPMTYPPYNINGVMLGGMLTPEDSDDYVYPPGEIEVGEEFYGAEPFDEGDVASFIEHLISVTESQGRTFRELLSDREFDFSFCVFNKADTAQHFLWKYMDENHPNYEPTEASDGIRRVYGAVDDEIGKLIDLFDDDTDIVLVSDHGFGPLLKNYYINNWLMDNGFLKIKKNPLSLFRKILHVAGFTVSNVYRILESAGLDKYIKQIALGPDKSGVEMGLNFFLSMDDVDMPRTEAYSTDNLGPIYLNMKGRDPDGRLDEDSYEKARENIQFGLKSLTFQGKPIFEDVIKKEELYHGPHSEDAADLVLMPRDNLFTATRHLEFGSNQLLDEPKLSMSGSHRVEGLFIASGPSFETMSNASLHIYDILPLMLHLFKMPIPSDADGSLREEFLNVDHQAKYGEYDIEDVQEIRGDTANSSVKDKLKDLGYMG